LGLIDAGLRKGDRVALLSENRPEWAISDLTILAAGGIDVLIFPSLTPSQIEYIVRDSGAKIICVSTEKQLEKVEVIREKVAHLERVILFDFVEAGTDERTLTFDQVCDRGQTIENADEVYSKSRDAATPDDLGERQGKVRKRA
jgi:long-chain acyl-CoA synthetase